MRRIFKKGSVAVVILFFLATTVTTVSTSAPGGNKNVSGSNSESVILTLRLRTSEESGSCELCETKLTIQEFKFVHKEIKSLHEKLSAIDDPIEAQKLVERILDVLRNFSILPKTFTLKNLTELVEDIGEGMLSLNQINTCSATDEYDDSSPLFVPGRPYLSIGPSVFAYICPLGTTKPFGLSPNGFVAEPIVGLTKINIKLNATGIYINKTGPNPFVHNSTILISAPLWKDIWGLFGEKSWVNYTEMHLIGFYYAEIIIGHSMAFGFAWPDVIMGGSLKPQFIIGSFWYLGGFTFPISLTLYNTWPEPWTVLMDIGIVPSLVGSVTIPLRFPSG